MKLFRVVFWLAIFVVAIALLPMMTKLWFALMQLAYVWLGLVGFFVLYRTLLKNRLGFLQTLDHEMSHTMISLLFGHSMVEMYVHDRMGGHVVYSGHGRGVMLINLAPYVLRIPMVLLGFLSFFVNYDSNAVKVFYVLLGAVLCYCMISIVEEAKPYQTDLLQQGLFLSYCAILALNIIWFCVIISIVLPSFALLDVIKSLSYHLQQLGALLSSYLS